MSEKKYGEFNENVLVTCNNCGRKFITGSLKKEINVDICSNCHPFYTGSGGNVVEKKGRVAKFNAKYRKSENSTN